MIRYILLLGGNIGDSNAALDKATEYIKTEAGTVLAFSPRIWTAAIGKGVTRDFLNQALLIESSLDPEELLDVLEAIERKMGRDKPLAVNWNVDNREYSDRIIDIDIAYVDFFGGNDFSGHWESPRLVIPHRAINERSYIGQLVSKIV